MQNDVTQRHIAVEDQDDDVIIEYLHTSGSAPETCTEQNNTQTAQPPPPPTPDSHESHIVIETEQQEPVVTTDDTHDTDNEDDLFVDAPEPTQEQEQAELRSRGLRQGLRPRESLKPVVKYQAGFA